MAVAEIQMLAGRPTEQQKLRLAGLFGCDEWRELCSIAEFARALDTSLDQARRIALRHLADKELLRRRGQLA
jgi:hypothetical protein